MKPNAFDMVLKIMESDCHSLAEIAKLSGYDPFIFYRSADLSGLDLTGQNLAGLNFDYADLRGAKLDNISFDIGAFNNAILPLEKKSLIDSYDCYLSDVILPHAHRIYAFGAIREGLIESTLEMSGISFASFAEMSGISTSTVRKARRSDALSMDSLLSLSRALIEIGSNNVPAIFRNVVRQPSLTILRVQNSGGFLEIRRDDYLSYVDMARQIYTLRKEAHPESTHIDYWRDSPHHLPRIVANYSFSNSFESLFAEVEDNEIDNTDEPSLFPIFRR